MKSSEFYTEVAVNFNVSWETVSKVYDHILEAHVEIAKKHLWFFTKEEVQMTMPDSFKTFHKNCRVIIGKCFSLYFTIDL